MKKCLIILKDLTKEKNINYQDYDCFIGVEKGAVFLLKQEELTNKHYISDFDTINKDFVLELKKEKNINILDTLRDYVDTEEAIKYANNLGYKNHNIVIFADEDLGRKDHLFNLFNLARKYKVIIYGNKFKITPIMKNEWKIIEKAGYKYLSIFIFKKTFINTKGLRWNLNNKEFDLNSATNLISNEILKEKCEIKTSELSLIMQAND